MRLTNTDYIDVIKQMLGCLWGDFWGQEIPNLHDPYIAIVPLYCMIMNARKAFSGKLLYY